MKLIPIQDTFAQNLQVILAGQNIALSLYQKSTGFFCDIYLNGSVILTGVLCLNAVKIVRDSYLNFPGDLAFWDTQGNSDPTSPGLGTRYLLAFIEEGE